MGRDRRLLNGHEVKEVVDTIFMDEFRLKPLEAYGDALRQRVVRLTVLLKKSYGIEMERARDVQLAYCRAPRATRL